MIEKLRAPIPDTLLFKGRPDDARLGDWIKRIDSIESLSSENPVVILGCPDNQGVQLNRGRAGAEGGPDSIRKHLYRMTPPMDFHSGKTHSHCMIAAISSWTTTSGKRTQGRENWRVK